MRKPANLSQWADLVLRGGLALVFIWAGAAKLLDVKSFAKVISQYNLLPDTLLPYAAFGLPALEVLAGVGLLLGVRGSLSVITAMLMLFVGVLWFGVLQGLSVDCGCFSAAEQAEHDGLRAALLRDLLMLAAVAWLHWRSSSRTDRGHQAPPDAGRQSILRLNT